MPCDMISYKTKEEIELIKQSADVLGRAHAEVAKMIRPGVKTLDLDKRAEEFIRDEGGSPSFKNYSGFPYSLCISINENVVHGFPGEYEVREGDVLSVDCGVLLNGYHSDSAYTYSVGKVSDDVRALIRDDMERVNDAIQRELHSDGIESETLALPYRIMSRREDILW